MTVVKFVLVWINWTMRNKCSTFSLYLSVLLMFDKWFIDLNSYIFCVCQVQCFKLTGSKVKHICFLLINGFSTHQCNFSSFYRVLLICAVWKVIIYILTSCYLLCLGCYDFEEIGIVFLILFEKLRPISEIFKTMIWAGVCTAKLDKRFMLYWCIERGTA